MSDPLRIVQLNLAYDSTLVRPEALLDQYHTLTGWSVAMTRAGAAIRVVQRFGATACVTDNDVAYDFVQEGPSGTPDPWSTFPRVIEAVRTARPEVVHVNGLMFPGMVSALRSSLSPDTVIVLQDHSGYVPRRRPGPLQALSAGGWKRAFDAADAFTFTAAELAEPWYSWGLRRNGRLIEIPEASTNMVPTPRDAAERVTGVRASPALLWVGRLDTNKDPLTVLAGLEIALPRLAEARCWMIYGQNSLEQAVQRRVQESAVLRGRVVLVGAVSRTRIAAYYTAANVFLSGSHHEGSGYALMEAMACGATPCVTDIPAHRALTGDDGVRWAAGDVRACAAALVAAATRDPHTERVKVRRRFDAVLSWEVIGRRTLGAYRDLVTRRIQMAGH